MERLDIEYVPNIHNLATVSELSPIEDFWSEIKRKLHEKIGKLKILTSVDFNRVHLLGKDMFTWTEFGDIGRKKYSFSFILLMKQ